MLTSQSLTIGSVKVYAADLGYPVKFAENFSTQSCQMMLVFGMSQSEHFFLWDINRLQFICLKGNLDFLLLNRIINELTSWLNLFFGINSSLCCLFKQKYSVIVNCNNVLTEPKELKWWTNKCTLCTSNTNTNVIGWAVAPCYWVCHDRRSFI